MNFNSSIKLLYTQAFLKQVKMLKNEKAYGFT